MGSSTRVNIRQRTSDPEEDSTELDTTDQSTRPPTQQPAQQSRSVRHRRPTGYPGAQDPPDSSEESTDQMPAEQDSSSQSAPNGRENMFRRLSVLFTGRRRSSNRPDNAPYLDHAQRHRAMTLSRGSSLDGSPDSNESAAPTSTDDPIHKPSVLEPVKGNSAADPSNGDDDTAANLGPKPLSETQTSKPRAQSVSFPIVEGDPANVKQLFGTTKAMSQGRTGVLPGGSPRPRGISLPLSSFATDPLPSPGAGVDQMPDLMKMFSDSMEERRRNPTPAASKFQPITPVPTNTQSPEREEQRDAPRSIASMNRPAPLVPINTQSSERKTSLEPVSPKTTSGPPVNLRSILKKPSTSTSTNGDASKESNRASDSRHSRHDSTFSGPKSKPGSSSTPVAVPEPASSATAKTGSSASSETPVAVPEPSNSAKTKTGTSASSTAGPSTPSTPVAVPEPASPATAKTEMSASSTAGPSTRHIKIAEPERPDRDTEEHAKVKEAVNREIEAEKHRQQRGKRRMSLEATKAIDEDHDPELAEEIEKSMYATKKAKRDAMNLHRRSPSTIPVDDIILEEHERKDIDRVARKALARKRAVAAREADKQKRAIDKAAKKRQSNFQKHELKLSTHPAEDPNEDVDEVEAGPGPATRATQTRERIKDAVNSVSDGLNQAFKALSPKSQASQTHFFRGKGKGRVLNPDPESTMTSTRPDGSPYRRSSFVESVTSTSAPRNFSRPRNEGEWAGSSSRRSSVTGASAGRSRSRTPSQKSRATSPPGASSDSPVPPVPPLTYESRTPNQPPAFRNEPQMPVPHGDSVLRTVSGGYDRLSSGDDMRDSVNYADTPAGDQETFAANDDTSSITLPIVQRPKLGYARCFFRSKKMLKILISAPSSNTDDLQPQSRRASLRAE
ncbi:hypothetical protein C1H76_8538 [Elsinoe australis]|uniref:Uncharacterized protein n=1 Tax=Elsinoe australis TaxID=40998 RepID=A0A4V6DT61_9PEZI|nr:hypothetical protein C1H76_8538 [Elsinoe australis]